jgi:hypothetical protein
MRVKAGERLLRLDHEAAPALEVEPEGDVVRDRVAGADVHVRAGLDIREDEIEMIVLEILCVGKLHHFACCAGRCLRL